MEAFDSSKIRISSFRLYRTLIAAPSTRIKGHEPDLPLPFLIDNSQNMLLGNSPLRDFSPSKSLFNFLRPPQRFSDLTFGYDEPMSPQNLELFVSVTSVNNFFGHIHPRCFLSSEVPKQVGRSVAALSRLIITHIMSFMLGLNRISFTGNALARGNNSAGGFPKTACYRLQ